MWRVCCWRAAQAAGARSRSGRRSAQAARGSSVNCVAESALLVLAGTLVGVAIAVLSLDALVALSPADIPRLDTTAFDRGVFAFAAAMAVMTALIVGLAPAWQLTSPSLVDDLKGDSTGTTTRSMSARTRRTFVTLQIAATLVLLIAAGLCVQSFGRLNRLDLGFDPTNVLTFGIESLEERYPDRVQRTHAVEQLIARFERVPHVIAAGAVLQRPFEHGAIGMDSGFILEGQPPTPDTFMQNPMLNWESVTPGYFRTMGIRLLRGRTFDERDTARSPLVVIVSEAMASRVWPGQDPIGKRLSTHGAQERDDQWQTVVGVVASARYREIESPRLDVYVPLRQAESFVKHYVVRTAIDPVAVAATLKAETAAVDRALTIGGVKTMEEIVARTKGPWRFNMLVFSLFGLVALGLSATGLFALIAYSVAQRTPRDRHPDRARRQPRRCHPADAGRRCGALRNWCRVRPDRGGASDPAALGAAVWHQRHRSGYVRCRVRAARRGRGTRELLTGAQGGSRRSAHRAQDRVAPNRCWMTSVRYICIDAQANRGSCWGGSIPVRSTISKLLILRAQIDHPNRRFEPALLGGLSLRTSIIPPKSARATAYCGWSLLLRRWSREVLVSKHASAETAADGWQSCDVAPRDAEVSGMGSTLSY